LGQRMAGGMETGHRKGARPARTQTRSPREPCAFLLC
jgi:hypothetical protein